MELSLLMMRGGEAGVRPDSPAPADLAGAPSSKPGDLDPEELKNGQEKCLLKPDVVSLSGMGTGFRQTASPREGTVAEVGPLEVPGGNRMGFTGQGRAAKEEVPQP